ncbi:MAG: hypothetical protein JWO59_2488 [Chloroflexi bacterium]|nr:hypothetical protein [Chloroflexota bacterium]
MNALTHERTAGHAVGPTRARRKGELRRWLVRIGIGFLTLPALLGLLFAIPPTRAFLIDQIIYQGDIFFPVQQKAAVVRLVSPYPGAAPIALTVPVRHGTVVRGIVASPALHGARRSYLVYLPPGYTDPANRGRRYPVLYLLHGSPGTPDDWLRGVHAEYAANEQIAAGLLPPLIMVMPDVNGDRWRDTQCVNKWDGTDNEMDYLVRDVVPTIDARYRTITNPAHRAIGGLSSGGYCAFNVGLRHPALFGTLFSMSGYFHALRGEVFGSNNPYGHNPRFLAANSPDRYVGLVPGVRHMHLLIYDSTADGSYAGFARAFDRQLSHLGIPHRLVMRHPTDFLIWDHTWLYWRGAFRQALPAVGASFGR